MSGRRARAERKLHGVQPANPNIRMAVPARVVVVPPEVFDEQGQIMCMRCRRPFTPAGRAAREVEIAYVGHAKLAKHSPVPSLGIVEQGGRLQAWSWPAR